jgi:excisionase family DNA binding protein
MNGTLTTRQVSEALQCTISTVVKLIRDGKLRAFRVGYRYRIKTEELQKFTDCGQQASSTEE